MLVSFDVIWFIANVLLKETINIINSVLFFVIMNPSIPNMKLENMKLLQFPMKKMLFY